MGTVASNLSGSRNSSFATAHSKKKRGIPLPTKNKKTKEVLENLMAKTKT